MRIWQCADVFSIAPAVLSWQLAKGILFVFVVKRGLVSIYEYIYIYLYIFIYIYIFKAKKTGARHF